MPTIIGSTKIVEKATGSKVVEKQQKSSMEVHIEQEELRWKKQLLNNQAATDMKPWLIQLSNMVNSRNLDAIQLLFIEWARGTGFTNEAFAQALEDKLFIKNNFVTFAKVVYNKYLQLFDDCNKKMRGTKVKPTKYMFEKKPSLSEKQYKRLIEVEDLIEQFVMKGGF